MKNTREIKFRAIAKTGKRKGGFIYGDLRQVNDKSCYISGGPNNNELEPADYKTVGQFTGLKDKNGKEVFEGDIVRWRTPYRSTQTHTGDNIPNGSYTEPMEPEIREDISVVSFKYGSFVVDNNPGFTSGECALSWVIQDHDEQSLKTETGWHNFDISNVDTWSNGEDGDLDYLLDQYSQKDIQSLLKWINGLEVIGNVHQNPELLS